MTARNRVVREPYATWCGRTPVEIIHGLLSDFVMPLGRGGRQALLPAALVERLLLQEDEAPEELRELGGVLGGKALEHLALKLHVRRCGLEGDVASRLRRAQDDLASVSRALLAGEQALGLEALDAVRETARGDEDLRLQDFRRELAPRIAREHGHHLELVAAEVEAGEVGGEPALDVMAHPDDAGDDGDALRLHAGDGVPLFDERVDEVLELQMLKENMARSEVKANP